MQVSQIVMIRFGRIGWPIDHQPEFLKFAAGLAQRVLQPNLSPREPGRTPLTTRGSPTGGLPLKIEKQILCAQRLRRTPESFSWVDHRLVRDGYLT